MFSQLNGYLELTLLKDVKQKLKDICLKIEQLLQQNRKLGFEHSQQKLSYEDMTKQVNKNKKHIDDLKDKKQDLELDLHNIKQRIVIKRNFVPDNLLVSQEQLHNILNIVNEIVEQYNKDELCLSYPVDVQCTPDMVTITILPLEDKIYAFPGFKVTKFSNKIILQKKI